MLLCAAAATASDVLFVHVGKTCGGTIAAELRKNRVAYHEVHLDKVDRETLAQYKRVIVSARGPQFPAIFCSRVRDARLSTSPPPSRASARLASICLTASSSDCGK